MTQLRAVESSGAPSTRPNSPWFEPSPALGISLMDHLYNRLDGAYPHKWRSNFSNQQAIDNWAESWAEAFEEEGITPHEIKGGLKECRRRFAWPPSCAEFIQACKPEIDVNLAYYEAVAGVQARFMGEHGTWSHPAIYWAAMPMAQELREQPHKFVAGRWEAALKAQLEKGAWEKIDEPALQLEAPGKHKTNNEQAKRAIANLLVGVLHKPEGQDEKAWAKRILARHEAGESITPHQLKEARTALRVSGSVSPE